MAVWKKILLLLVLILLTCVAIGVIILKEYSIEVTLKGADTVTVECGGQYKEAGAEVSFQGVALFGELTPADIQVNGTVDTRKPGTYELTYSVSRELDYFLGEAVYDASAKRVVHVVDTVPPVITLLTDETYFTLPGGEYQEEGYSAQDICDGDMTEQVRRWTEGDLVYYQVTDTAGNTAQVTRQIVYSDPIAPTILLEGKQECIVVVGGTYTEPGYAAFDNLDGELTGQVVVTGTVDGKTLGTYPIEYAVTDAHGNVTKVIRNVIVREFPELPDNMFPGQAEEPVDPGDKVVYLTFDDGPCEYTNQLLDILKKYDVKATFFVVNRGNHEILKRIAEEGHTLAMHCGQHNYRKIYASEEAYFKDLKEIQDLIYEVTGQKSTIVRFPGGSDNTVSRFNPKIMTRLTMMLDAMGYRYFDWNVNARDSEGTPQTRAGVAGEVIYGMKRHNVSVVLQHDLKHFSVLAVDEIVRWGLENGYTFLPLSNNSPTCESRVNN